MTTIPFLDYKISARGIEGDAQEALSWIQEGQKKKVVATINAHSTCVAADDDLFKQALQKADLLIPDGISIVLAANALGFKIPERVSGFDFFESFSRLANEKGNVSYFFLGSSDTVLNKIAGRLAADYPNIRLAGMLSPPFKAEFTQDDNAALCAAINAAKPDVLWVGMTAPKQEKWIESNTTTLDIGFAAAIGAVFDFYAGTKERAPVWVRRLGLEWLHRLVTEPKRVWRRYIINNPRFVWLVLKAKIGLS